jgi:hypothetical protein
MTDFNSFVDLLMKFVPFLAMVWKAIQWIRNRIRWRGISKDARDIALAFQRYSWNDLHRCLPDITGIGLILVFRQK